MLGDKTAAPQADAADKDVKFKPRRREAKGERPFFLKDPDSDRLLAIITALVAEVSVVRERLDTTERLAAKGLMPTAANIEAYHPDPDVEAQREAVRSAMLHRVYRILMSERKPDPGEPRYETVIDQFSTKQER